MKYIYDSQLVALDPEDNLANALNAVEERGFEIFSIIPIRHISALIVYRAKVLLSASPQVRAKKP